MLESYWQESRGDESDASQDSAILEHIPGIRRCREQIIIA
jgi:hypothetical protein